jgi:hypothetical protein
MAVRKYICPQCRGKSGVNIVYGYPGFDLRERSERGEVHIGGCVLTEDQPDRHCTSCEHEWQIRRRRSKRDFRVDCFDPISGLSIASPLNRAPAG